MFEPPALVAAVEAIPTELRARKQWVGWAWKRIEPGGDHPVRWTKVPINPHTGGDASSTSPTTWGSLGDALSRMDRDGLAGIGYVFSGDDPYTGVDLDKCRDPLTERIEPWAAEIVADLDSYTELSPSETGLHLIVRATKPAGRSRRGPIELYDRGRYFTITGHRLAGAPATIEARQAGIDALHRRVFGTEPVERPAGAGDPLLSDGDILEKCRTARNSSKFADLWMGNATAYDSASEADLALCSLFAFYTGDPEQIDRLFRRSGLCREKWRTRADYRDRTIEAALRRDETWEPPGTAPRRTGRVADGVTGAADDVQAAVPPHLKVIRMSDVEERDIDWLWPAWLAKGELSIHGALPGTGKTTFSLAMTAAFSTGGALPDGSTAPQTRVLLMLAEDSVQTTIKRELRLHGADMDNVFAVQAYTDEKGRDRAINLATHLDYLEALVLEHQAGLVILDPIGSYTPGKDRNSEGDVRDALTPLRQLAERHQFAVLGIMHFGKPNGPQRTLLQSLLGSTGYVALARTVFVTAELPADRQPEAAAIETGLHRVTQIIKSNLDIKPPAISWRRPKDAAIEWLGESEISAEDALSATRTSPAGDAQTWLAGHLAGGMQRSADVRRTAEQAGHAERTLERAKRALGVEAVQIRRDGVNAWYWKLLGGEHTAAPNPERQGQAAGAASEAGGGLSGNDEMGAERHAGQVAVWAENGATRPVASGHRAAVNLDLAAAGEWRIAKETQTATLSYTEGWRSAARTGTVCVQCNVPIASGTYCRAHGGDAPTSDPVPFVPRARCDCADTCQRSGHCCFPAHWKGTA